MKRTECKRFVRGRFFGDNFDKNSHYGGNGLCEIRDGILLPCEYKNDNDDVDNCEVLLGRQ